MNGELAAGAFKDYPPNRMKSLSLLVPLLLVASHLTSRAADTAPATKDAAEVKLPPAKEIVARFVQASGGRENWLKHTSQKSSGKFILAGQGLNGDMEAFAAKPDKLVIKLRLPGLGEVLNGFDGKVGYSVDAATGPRLLEGKELEQLREQADFYSVLHDDKNFKSMVTVAAETFEGQDCYRVKLVRTSGDEITEFFDRKSGFLIGMVSTQASPLGPMEVTSVVSNYKKFADVVLAAKTSQKMGGIEQILTLDAVEFDTVPASAFELPAQIKGLLPKQQ